MEAAQYIPVRNRFIVLYKLNRESNGRFKVTVIKTFKKMTAIVGKDALRIMRFENIDRNISICKNFHTICHQTNRRIVNDHYVIQRLQLFQNFLETFAEDQFRRIWRNRPCRYEIKVFDR